MLTFLATSTSPTVAPAPVKAPEVTDARSDDRVVVIGVGAAFDLGTPFGAGAAAFVEHEVVEGVLELELGAQVVGKPGGPEWSVDLLGKWPRRLTDSLEVMIGAGPTIVAARGDKRSTRWGLEGAVDLMWWPTHRVGLWVEPSYAVLFGQGSAGFSFTLGPILGL